MTRRNETSQRKTFGHAAGSPLRKERMHEGIAVIRDERGVLDDPSQ
jgi:hypothetical protein